MSEQNTITLTQDELDDIIAKRVARIRKDYEDNGQESWRFYARRWEGRCKAAQAELSAVLVDRNTWRARAKWNRSQTEALEKMNADLLDRLAGAK